MFLLSGAGLTLTHHGRAWNLSWVGCAQVGDKAFRGIEFTVLFLRAIFISYRLWHNRNDLFLIRVHDGTMTISELTCLCFFVKQPSQGYLCTAMRLCTINSAHQHIMLAVDTFTLLTRVWNINKTLSHRLSKCFKVKVFFVLSHETTTLPSTWVSD